jgi:hypothetical protein
MRTVSGSKLVAPAGDATAVAVPIVDIVTTT